MVGASWLSQFEWFAHEKLALKAGVTLEAIRSVKEGVAPAQAQGMSEAQRAVYRYCRELHKSKRVCEQTHREALAAVGGQWLAAIEPRFLLWMRQGLVDLVFTMGFYHQISMTLNAFEVPLPKGVEPPFEEPSSP